MASPYATVMVTIVKQNLTNPQKHVAFAVRMCNAISEAWSLWQSQALLVDVKINAALATGGKLRGPVLDMEIVRRMNPRDQWETRLTTQMAKALNEGWKGFTDSVSVPGLPWYPGFIFYPAPFAPPTPNLPFPLVALRCNLSGLENMALRATMVSRIGAGVEGAPAIAAAVADGFYRAFRAWMAATLVTGVLGSGPVPTFAPPYVPGGPVVGGKGSMLSPGLK